MAFRGRGGDFFSNVEPLFPGGKPPDIASFMPSKGTRRLLYVVGVLLFLFVVLRPVVGVYTDLLWYRSLGFPQLYLTQFQYQGWIFAASFVVAFAALAASSAYSVRQVGFSALSAIGVRRRFLTAAAGRLVILAAAVVALIFAAVASGEWETVAKALNGGSFNRAEPVFGQDVGFYVFQLPLYRFIWGWLLALLVVCAAAALFVYLSRGSSQTLPPRAITHLSLLGAAFFLLLAVHYRLAMFQMLFSKNGYVFGAGYTDVHVRIPVYWIMLVLTAILALVMIANAVLRRQLGLLVPVGIWLVSAVVLIGVVPALFERAVVTPSQLAQEHDYIQREIDSTNAAYGTDKVVTNDFPDKQQVAPDLLAANTGTVSNLRLWDYVPLQAAYNQLQTLRQYYHFERVAIDRYKLSDGYHQLMLSARELSPDLLSTTAQTWVNVHLKYTHGYGVTATQVAKVGPEGKPDLTLRDIPPVGEPGITQPQIYFGEKSSNYVLVGGREQEVDFEKGDIQQYSQWKGTHGVRMSGGLRKLAYAYQLGDLNLLLSTQVTADSQLLYKRTVQDRLHTLAPFLTFDQDPYIVVSGGKPYWIVDGFTTSSSYPYSNPYQDGAPTYIRNSVKAVMDAYEGTVTFYVADSADPVLATYQRIYPGAFTPINQMPADLRTHVRYPELLFSIQAQVLENYHMHDPQAFYNRADTWSQPNEITQQGAPAAALQPYYVVMKLPGQDHEEFALIQPFTPLNKTTMVAWIAARSDGADYGKLVAFRFPTDRQVTGPEQVESRIDQDPTISAQLSLLNQNGSKVVRGNLLVIPIGDAILFVEPIYLESTGNNAIPELKKVVVADESRVVWADTLDLALQALTGAAPATQPTTGPTTGPATGPSATPTPGVSQSVQQLITRAQQLYADAQARLKAGDLGGYAADVQQLGPILDQIRAATGTPVAAPSPRSSPRPSPSP